MSTRFRSLWCRPVFGLGCWLLLLAGLVRGPAYGQAAAVWQQDPVLSPLLINQMVTDASGFRWVATDNGVFRYDGNELVPLKSLVRQGVLPKVESVPALALDPAGCLWLGTGSGLSRFEPRTGELLAVPLPLRPGELPWIRALLPDPRTNRLWVGYGQGAVAVLALAHPRTPLFPVVHVAATNFYFTLETGGDGVWLLNDNPTLYYLAPTGAVRRQLRLSADLVAVPGTRPQRFWGRDGLFVLDSAFRLRTLRRWPRRLPGLSYAPFVTDSTLDALAGGQWLHVADLRGPRPRLLSTPVAGLPGDPHSAMLERDAYGTWWRYTRGWRGCYKQRPIRRVVEAVRRAGGAAAGSTRLITRLPDGRLLVSTYSGFFTQAADSPAAPLRPLALRHISSNAPFSSEFGALYAVPGRPFAVVADENGGVVRLNFRSGVVSNLAGGPLTDWRRETNGPIRAYGLLRDHAGRLWAGGQMGLYRVQPDFAGLHRVADERPDWPLHQLEVSGLAEDPATGALWVSTNGGLFWLPPDHPEQLRRYALSGPAGRALPTNALACVAAAGPGRAWVGTLDQGLLLVDARTGLVRQLGLNDGLPSLSIATLLPTRTGALWLGTYAGLVRYVPGRGQLAVLGEAEGFDVAELNRRAAFADADGTLWFGGVGGVYRVRAGQGWTPAPVRPARLLLTAVGTPAGTVETVQPLPAGYRGPLTLAAGPLAFVELRLALTDFFAPAHARYAYRLHYATEAQPTPWLSTARRLVLRGLAPGEYEVEIRAETASGQPAANHLRVPLHVAALWWQRPVVWALAALLLVGLGYGLYALQLRRVRREAARRSALAANLHDEVGALLTRVTMLAEVLQENHQPPPGESAGPFDTRHVLERLVLNSRAAVQTMRDVVWGIDSRADSGGSLLDRMREHLDQTAAAAGLSVGLTHTGLNEAAPLPASVRQNLYLVFKEAVTNTLRHAPTATEIRVHVGSRDGKLWLEVSDNGPGPDPQAARPSGMGLRNMAQRAHALGAHLHTGPRPDGRPGYHVRVAMR